MVFPQSGRWARAGPGFWDVAESEFLEIVHNADPEEVDALWERYLQQAPVQMLQVVRPDPAPPAEIVATESSATSPERRYLEDVRQRLAKQALDNSNELQVMQHADPVERTEFEKVWLDNWPNVPHHLIEYYLSRATEVAGRLEAGPVNSPNRAEPVNNQNPSIRAPHYAGDYDKCFVCKELFGYGVGTSIYNEECGHVICYGCMKEAVQSLKTDVTLNVTKCCERSDVLPPSLAAQALNEDDLAFYTKVYEMLRGPTQFTMEDLQEKGVTRCPQTKCAFPIEKLEGCNHMR